MTAAGPPVEMGFPNRADTEGAVVASITSSIDLRGSKLIVEVTDGIDLVAKGCDVGAPFSRVVMIVCITFISSV